VQVSTPDNRRSNVLRFRVETPVKEEKTAEKAPAETTAVKPTAKAETKAAAKTPEPAMVKTKPVSTAKPTTNEPAKTAEKRAIPASTKETKDSGIRGYEWYASQPKSSFTLQLLASEKRQNVEAYAKQHKLKSPLGEFVMEHNGKQLYALTQGSYPNRASAEKAAASLPAGIKPWVRTMASIQKVMKREKPVVAKAKAAVEPVASGERYKDTAWVWSQDPNHYTVQLSAASSEQAIEADMRRISLPGEMTVVQTLRDGKPWYALLYGSFATKEAARGTIARLPAKLRQAGPWPRSFASLQDEISRSTPAR
jgi:septal ring-binding cell division protein DamX